MAHVREFSTGATRDAEKGKPDYEGYLSPTVIQRYGQYMLANQQTPAGLRASDNWQLGIPRDEYMKSLLRHVVTAWSSYRTGDQSSEMFLDSLCAIWFNTQGLIHETIKTNRISISCRGT